MDSEAETCPAYFPTRARFRTHECRVLYFAGHPTWDGLTVTVVKRYRALYTKDVLKSSQIELKLHITH